MLCSPSEDLEILIEEFRSSWTELKFTHEVYKLVCLLLVFTSSIELVLKVNSAFGLPLQLSHPIRFIAAVACSLPHLVERDQEFELPPRNIDAVEVIIAAIRSPAVPLESPVQSLSAACTFTDGFIEIENLP